MHCMVAECVKKRKKKKKEASKCWLTVIIQSKTGTVMEPPLQRKKRCTGPPTTLSTDFNQFPDAASDDFALLGRNDKFMENVRYKAKSHHTAPAREASPPKQQRLQVSVG